MRLDKLLNTVMHTFLILDQGMSEAFLQAAALSKILVLSTIPSFQEFSKKSCNESGNIIFLNTVYDLDKIEVKKNVTQIYDLSWCDPKVMSGAYLTIE